MLGNEDCPDLMPGRGEVPVKVAAASINPVDQIEHKGMAKDWKVKT